MKISCEIKEELWTQLNGYLENQFHGSIKQQLEWRLWDQIYQLTYWHIRETLEDQFRIQIQEELIND